MEKISKPNIHAHAYIHPNFPKTLSSSPRLLQILENSPKLLITLTNTFGTFTKISELSQILLNSPELSHTLPLSNFSNFWYNAFYATMWFPKLKDFHARNVKVCLVVVDAAVFSNIYGRGSTFHHDGENFLI